MKKMIKYACLKLTFFYEYITLEFKKASLIRISSWILCLLGVDALIRN